MNTVCDIDMCAGCMLCSDCCPHNAITIKKSFQAYNAVIDESNALIAICAINCVKLTIVRILKHQSIGHRAGRMMRKYVIMRLQVASRQR